MTQETPRYFVPDDIIAEFREPFMSPWPLLIVLPWNQITVLDDVPSGSVQYFLKKTIERQLRDVRGDIEEAWHLDLVKTIVASVLNEAIDRGDIERVPLQIDVSVSFNANNYTEPLRLHDVHW